ncbi:hypothetical protein DVH24_002962 [Malus domestica]|uniref:B box-type domain-containing protein n=1 Tax=Malus domestica TaxID=3750 RepID=A0A498K988_MALDO|nr:hypothetical protein DVH24_002962 [Malus domestica]
MRRRGSSLLSVRREGSQSEQAREQAPRLRAQCYHGTDDDLQEAVGYFFCLEDRALLCRKCDVAVHTANSFVLARRRFLLTGMKSDFGDGDGVVVGVGASYSTVKSRYGSVSRYETQNPLPVECTVTLPGVAGGMSFTGGSAARTIPQCYMDEFLGLSNLDQNFGYVDNGSSKVCAHYSHAINSIHLRLFCRINFKYM